MTADLYDRKVTPAEVFLRAWLIPLATDPALVGSQRWAAGMGLPYRMVRRLSGPTDLISDFPTVRVHTFAATYTDAAREADRTHRRMLLLARDLPDVTVASGVVASCASCDVLTGPREEPYGAESVVVRFICEYDLELRFVSV
ncbi:MAG TPA: hypothetical protein PLF91_00165 [Mycolicibacterium fallax]|nr:hypothetical protein [Mycolicibacterium fallax]